MRFLSYLTGLFVFALIAQPSAQAAIFFGFGVNGSAPLATNEVNAFVNDLLTINVYLVEDDIPLPDTRLTDNGVLNFDFVADYQNTFGNVTSVMTSNAFPVFQIEQINEVPSPSFSNFRMAGTEASFINGVEPDPGTRYVELGNFMFQVTDAGITEFVFTDPDPSPGVDNNGLGAPSFEIIDTEIFVTIPPPMFRVVSATAIPEPSSFAALAGLLCVGALRLRRRRKAKSAA